MGIFFGKRFGALLWFSRQANAKHASLYLSTCFLLLITDSSKRKQETQTCNNVIRTGADHEFRMKVAKKKKKTPRRR